MKFLYSILLIHICLLTLAQEAVTNYISNHKLNETHHQQFLKQKSKLRTTALSLPFIEDFYQTDVYPNVSKWQDNFVYINQTFQINPISIGVAIFDGINPVGQAYSLLSNAIGDADKLSSQAIDLNGLSFADNVLMSFFYAYETNGEAPESGIDFLRLEFLDSNSTWHKVWEKTPTNNDTTSIFKQVYVRIDSSFLHANFQFRFINRGNLAGLNDIWAVDYIRIDKNRDSIFDSNINDMAFQYPSPSLLKNYYSMPYAHFDSTQTKDSIEIYIKNNFINPTTDIVDRYSAEVLNDNTEIGLYNGPSRDYFPLTVNKVKYPLYTIPTTYTDDTVLVEMNYSFDVSAEDASNATILENNILKHKQIFSNYFSYDDGSAERGYWIRDSENYRMAVKYKLSHADTLRAIKMQFTSVKTDINTATFSIVVWKNVTINSNTEEIIYQHDNLKIADLVKEYGYDTINGFLYYNINADFITNSNYSYPLVLSDSFLVGLIVNNINSLTIGFDINNNKKEQNFYFHTKVGSSTANKWFSSDIDGTMIINPIFGKALQGYITPILDNKKYDIKLYPNPAKKYIYISGIKEETQVNILDLNGKLVQTFDTKIDRIINIENLLPAIYVIQVHNLKTNEFGYSKFIKTNE
jgi:hypothetical protein